MRLGWLGTYARTQHSDHDAVVGQGEIDLVHDQNLVISEARVSVDVGLSRRFAASLMVPVRIVGTSIRYLDMAGNEVQLENPGIHHRNETVAGLGDPMLLGSVSSSFAGWRLTARAGATLPIGRTEENPFVLGDMGLRHQHIQMGTGTVNPVVAVELSRTWGRWRAGAFALSQQVVYENANGYQAGDRYAGGIALRRQVGSRWSLRAGLDALGESAERWDGAVPTDDGNRGRFDLIAGAGASWRATDRLGLDLALKLPAITHTVGGQLDMPAIVEVGVSWFLGGGTRRAEEHGHSHDEHSHGEHSHDEHAHDEHAHEEQLAAPAHPDTAGADVADLGKPGEAVELVPVRGKVTIFDFWATWCAPCKVLEQSLLELARAHPDVVAIRRVDTVDWDSAAVARYLTPKGFSLPHLKIADPSGRMILEQSVESGGMEATIEKVRAIVRQADSSASESAPPPAPEPAPTPELKPEPQPEPAPPPRQKPRPQVTPAPAVPIVVTSRGFEPSNVKVRAGQPVTLRFLRKVERTCATEVVMDVNGKRLVKDLPLDQAVEIRLVFPAPGRVDYACAMGMIRGSITVE